VIELCSEIGGQFVVTSNTHGSIDWSRRPRRRSSACRSHRSCSTWSRGTRLGSSRCCASRAHADQLRIVRRGARLDRARARRDVSKHRQKVGALSRDELERLKGRPLTASEEAFLREVQSREAG
jgi:hypothetical protein